MRIALWSVTQVFIYKAVDPTERIGDNDANTASLNCPKPSHASTIQFPPTFLDWPYREDRSPDNRITDHGQQ